MSCLKCDCFLSDPILTSISIATGFSNLEMLCLYKNVSFSRILLTCCTRAWCLLSPSLGHALSTSLRQRYHASSHESLRLRTASPLKKDFSRKPLRMRGFRRKTRLLHGGAAVSALLLSHGRAPHASFRNVAQLA